MPYQRLRDELTDYYAHQANDRAEAFCVHVLPLLDAQYRENMNAYEMKTLQYRVIAREMEPVLFHACPFYYETGTLPAHCDGARNFRGTRHAGGWTYWHNSRLFTDQDPELAALRGRQGQELLYLICGAYSDTNQHFPYNYKPVFAAGLRGLYDRATAELHGADETQQAYLEATRTGLLALKEISEKFARSALERMTHTSDLTARAYLSRIAEAAAYTPWNAPRTFYEALNMLAFLRKAVGALEGVGFNTFGRPDVTLLPFYEADLQAGRLSREEAFDLITRFLLMFDCHYDHDMKMVGYSDHELENTYTLGGCDADGEPVWNDLTEMFLRATREQKIIFPKIKCRYSERSPKAYLDAIDEDVIHGTSVILYQNDNAVIPALLRYGRTLAEARDYIVNGCWGLIANGCEKPDDGNYVNLLKPFEFSVHNRRDKCAEVGIDFLPFDDAESFEDIYRVTLDNVRKLFRARWEMSHRGKGIWSRVDPLPLFSAPLESCLEKRTDYTAGGAKYQDDHYMLVGFPNVVDSLLAIKTLCFDEKKYTLAELLAAVRANWEGYEVLRADCLKCPAWGDGSEESCALAARFNDDLYTLADALPPTLWGGRTQIGHLTYTEIRFWGERTLATPDGRYSGNYFSQGLTPSRLRRIDSVTSVIASLRCLDASKMAANTVVNIILPSASDDGRMSLSVCEAFLRAAAGSAMQSLQLNCVTRAELLDAQKHPERHRDLIVRVCGFSARFTSLSPDWQREVLSRNFYR